VRELLGAVVELVAEIPHRQTAANVALLGGDLFAAGGHAHVLDVKLERLDRATARLDEHMYAFRHRALFKHPADVWTSPERIRELIAKHLETYRQLAAAKGA
jgi:hypothetical protein